MLAFEGDAHVEWFEGNFEDYEADKIRRLGPDAVEPKRIKYQEVRAVRRLVAAVTYRCYPFAMTLEEIADLIRANSANTNGRIDAMRNESNAALMNIQNDLTDVRADIAEVRRNLDLTPVLSTMQRQIDALTAEVAELKRRAS